nr:hypothetical protein [Tanacetum cinerariifolium]
MCEMFCQIIQKKQEEKRIKEEQAANARYWKIPACCDDDDDYDSAIKPNEPVDSLSMGSEHLDTIPATKSDEIIKSCVENLVPNPRSLLNHDSSIIPCSSKIDSLLDEFAGELTLLKSIPSRVDKTDCYPKNEIRFSERLLYNNSSPRPSEEFVFENSDAEIKSFSPSPIPNEDSDSFMKEIDLFLTSDDPMPPSIEDDEDSEGDILFLERLLHDDPIPLLDTLDFSYEVRTFLPFFTYPIDSLLDEFAGEIILLKIIPPGIDETDCDPEEEIHLIEKLFDSFMKEIDLSFTPDDSMPPGIEEYDYDSEVDMLILKESLSNDSLSVLENESFHFDIPSFPRPPAKPPDDDSGILTVKMVGDISEHDVPMPKLLPAQPTLISNQKKSPHLLSHRGFKASQLHSECPMMIYGGNTPILDISFLHFYPP